MEKLCSWTTSAISATSIYVLYWVFLNLPVCMCSAPRLTSVYTCSITSLVPSPPPPLPSPPLPPHTDTHIIFCSWAYVQYQTLIQTEEQNKKKKWERPRMRLQYDCYLWQLISANIAVKLIKVVVLYNPLLLGHCTEINPYTQWLMSIFSPSQYLQVYLLGQLGQLGQWIQVSFEHRVQHLLEYVL